MGHDLTSQDVNSILDEFREVNKSAHELMTKAVKGMVISPEQCRLLFIIKKFDKLNQKCLSDKLHVTPATLSVRLQRLEKAGLLQRLPDKNDKRNTVLKVTNEGMMIIDQCLETMREATRQLFDDISKEEIDLMKECFLKINNNIKRMKEELDD